MSCRQSSLYLGALRAACALQAPGNSCQDWSHEESWDCTHPVSPAWDHPAAVGQKELARAGDIWGLLQGCWAPTQSW